MRQKSGNEAPNIIIMFFIHYFLADLKSNLKFFDINSCAKTMFLLSNHGRCAFLICNRILFSRSRKRKCRRKHEVRKTMMNSRSLLHYTALVLLFKVLSYCIICLRVLIYTPLPHKGSLEEFLHLIQ